MNAITDMIPLAKTLGVEIIEASAARVVGALEVRPALCTAGGTLHGGAAMAFADTLGAVGAYLALPQGATGTTTLESKTNFIGAARCGARVTGEALPVHAGGRTSVWQTRIVDEDGKLIALITQTQMVLRPQQS